MAGYSVRTVVRRMCIVHPAAIAGFVALGLACGWANAAPVPPAVAAEPARVTISLVGTNDLHGHIDTLPGLGGYLANLRRARGHDGGAVVLVDAGDMFQGTLASNLGEGAAVVRAYNALGYDAVAIGNHEFDFGPAGPAPAPRVVADDPRGALKARAAEAQFPFLAANVVEKATGAAPGWSNVRPTAMIDAAGVKVGIVGVTTIATPRATLAANFVGLAIRPLAPAIAAAARRLRREGARLVIVSAHAGGKCKAFDVPDDVGSCVAGAEIFAVARALPPGLVDAIVAGHTHEGIAHRVAGIPIIEAFAEGRAFGRVDFTLDRRSGRLLGTRIFAPQAICKRDRCAAESYEGAPVTPDAAADAAIAPALAAARDKHQELVGVIVEARIPRAYGTESALGNLFADLMRAATPGADVALTNGGGLRADLPAGPLRYGDLYEAMPFDNTLATVPITGAELAALVARNLRGAGGILSLSGVRVTAHCAGGSLHVTLSREDGRPVSPTDRLTLVTSDFLATGGDTLGPEVSRRARIGDRLIRDAMADVLRTRRAPLRPDELHDPARSRVRLTYPTPRPVRCASASRREVDQPL